MAEQVKQKSEVHEPRHPQQHDHGHDHGVECSVPSFDTKDIIMGEHILAKSKELAELMANSREVEFYKKAEAQVNEHEEVQALIKVIKKKQKEAVAFESFKNSTMVEKIEEEIDALHAQLDEYPIVNEFRQAQEDVNYLLQLIIGVIRDTVSDKINVEAGTIDPNASPCND